MILVIFTLLATNSHHDLITTLFNKNFELLSAAQALEEEIYMACALNVIKMCVSNGQALHGSDSQ